MFIKKILRFPHYLFFLGTLLKGFRLVMKEPIALDCAQVDGFSFLMFKPFFIKIRLLRVSFVSL